jgi:thiopeptide-type bacteriocin biosynthesis protein
MERHWLSVHLYSPVDLDLVLLHIVRPFIAQFFGIAASSSFFFIRYWDEGSHIRLRMQVSPAAEPLLIPSLEQHIRAIPPLGCQLKMANYEPEIARYGGAHTIHFAEQYFFLSSRYVLSHIVPKAGTRSILTDALYLQLTLLKALRWEMPRLCQLLDYFIAGWIRRLYDPQKDPQAEHIFWLSQFEENFNKKAQAFCPGTAALWEALEQGESDEPGRFIQQSELVLRDYLSAVNDTQKSLEICASLMHMNNNRVGLSNLDEAYAGYCLLRCLRYILSNTYHNK